PIEASSASAQPSCPRRIAAATSRAEPWGSVADALSDLLTWSPFAPCRRIPAAWLLTTPTRRSLASVVGGAAAPLVFATAAAGAGIIATRRRPGAPDRRRGGGSAARRFVVMIEGEGRIDHVLDDGLAIAFDRRHHLVAGEVAFFGEQFEGLEPVGEIGVVIEPGPLAGLRVDAAQEPDGPEIAGRFTVVVALHHRLQAFAGMQRRDDGQAMASQQAGEFLSLGAGHGLGPSVWLRAGFGATGQRERRLVGQRPGAAGQRGQEAVEFLEDHRGVGIDGFEQRVDSREFFVGERTSLVGFAHRGSISPAPGGGSDSDRKSTRLNSSRVK